MQRARHAYCVCLTRLLRALGLFRGGGCWQKLQISSGAPHQPQQGACRKFPLETWAVVSYCVSQTVAQVNEIREAIREERACEVQLQDLSLRLGL